MADEITDALERAHAAQRAASVWASGITPQQASNIGALSKTYPQLKPGVAVSLGASGVDPDSPLAQQAAKTATEEHAHKGWLDKIGDVVSGAMAAPRALTRWGLVGATAPIEGITGFARATYGASQAFADGGVGAADAYLREHGTLGDIAGQTTLGSAITVANNNQGSAASDFFGSVNPDDRGRSVLGDGWFPGVHSPAARLQHKNARDTAMVDGHAWTFGRGFASALPIEPGTLPYNIISGSVDVAATIGLDPVTYVGGAVAAGNRARGVIGAGPTTEVEMATRVVDPATGGLVDGLRTTVLPEKAHAWLAGPDGSKVADYFAAETDFERMRRATNRKLPVSLLVALKDATDPVTVKNLLADAVNQGSVYHAPDVSGAMRAAVGVDSSVWGVMRNQMGRRQPPRWTQAVPGRSIDLDDMDDAVEQLDRFQRNAKLPGDVISRNNEALARAGSNGERYQVVASAMTAVGDVLVQSGLKPRQAQRLTKMFRDSDEALRAFYVDDVGQAFRPAAANIGGNNFPLVSPHLPNELLDSKIPLPDPREIKRSISAFSPLFDTPYLSNATRGGIATLDFINNSLFKPLALMRAAWTLRVVGEEQVRIGAAGGASLINHPLSYLAIMAGDDGGNRASRAVLAGLRHTVGESSGTDALGVRFADIVAEDASSPVARALNRGSGGWLHADGTVQTSHWTVAGRDSDQYIGGWVDELTQLGMTPVGREAARKPLPEAQEWFWNTKLREQLVKEGFDGVKHPYDLTTRAGSDYYMGTVLDRLTTKTSSHPELMQAVATGKLRGEPLVIGGKPNPRAERILQELLDQGVGPEKVKARIRLTEDSGDPMVVRAARRYNAGIESGFNLLGAVPTNRLSRSPFFRQAYWGRMADMGGLLDDTSRAALLKAAEDANLPKAQMAALRKSTTGPAGTLGLEAADTVAKLHGLHETRALLYDLHGRGQFFDAYRLVLPFGEAWREVLTRWAKLANPVRGNPMVAYRLNQVVGEARRGGMFYPDPTTGEEMYAYPGGELLTGMLTGVPVKIEGQAQGLNTITGGATGIIPGVGPVIQYPVSKFLPDSPTFDDVRDMVAPYGEADLEGGFVESFLPAYMRKILAAAGKASPAQKRALASSTRDVQAYLYSTGDYDTSTPEGKDKLLRDAQHKAKMLYLLRGMAQFGAPSAPTYEYAVKDRDGHLTALHLVADEYRTLLEADPETATEKLLDTFGDSVFLATVGKTTGTAPTTEDVNHLARTHPDVARKYPKVWGLFTSPDSPFDPSESQRQVKAGQREAVTPQEALDIAHQRLGSAMYDQYRAMLPADPTTEQRMWLLKVRAGIKKKFPGYAATPQGLGDTERAVDEVIVAAKDPVLSQTDAGQGLTMYLQYREQALATANAGGLATFGQADAALPLRMWLRAAADKISQAHPDFGQLWDRVLDRELKDDSEATP